MSRNPLRELCGDPVGESGGVVSADSREARTGSTTIVDNAGVVLQGELTVVAENGLSKTFSAGSGIVELVNTFHYGENRGTVPVDLAMFYAGGADLPLSVKR